MRTRKRERAKGTRKGKDYKEARKPGKVRPDLLVSWLPYR
jgi:hypothetical protein